MSDVLTVHFRVMSWRTVSLVMNGDHAASSLPKPYGAEVIPCPAAGEPGGTDACTSVEYPSLSVMRVALVAYDNSNSAPAIWNLPSDDASCWLGFQPIAS